MFVIPFLLIIAYQDFKSREISWFYLPIIFTIALVSQLYQGNLLWLNWLFSFVFLVFQLLVVYLYFALKNKNFKIAFTDNFLGWGDILFLVAIVPLFDFKQYVIWYVFSLFFTLIFHLVFHQVFRRVLAGKSNKITIPLVGWMGIFYTLVLLIQFSLTFGK